MSDPVGMSSSMVTCSASRCASPSELYFLWYSVRGDELMTPPLTASRQEILRLLRTHGEMTVDALSRAMGISSVAARTSSRAASTSRCWRTATERRPVGRPCRVYSLTETAGEIFPQGYPGLALMILEHLRDRDGEEKVEEVFAARGERLEARYGPRMKGKSLRERVAAVARMQDEDGYMSEWEECPDGSFRLREYNCAICQVARCFPTVCDKEQELFARLLDADVTREEHVIAGDRRCSYVIKPK
jgi:predicted ArsR family transcriptional regulator